MSSLASAMIAETIRMTVPYACAALGGVLSERSGVVNIALEGKLLAGAFATAMVSLATGSIGLGALAGVAAGAAVGLVHALLVTRLRVHAMVSGLSVNLAVAGATRALLRTLHGSASNSPSFAHAAAGGEDGSVLAALTDPVTIGCASLVASLTIVLSRTRFGLRLRACGESPEAAQANGVSVAWTRVAAVTLAGAVVGAGGAALVLDLHQFQSGMSAGRGFVALAAVVVAGWRPLGAIGACVVFAALDAAQIVLQGATSLPPQLLGALPYLITLVVLAGATRGGAQGSRMPAGLGVDAPER